MSMMWYDPFDFVRQPRLRRRNYAFDTDDLFDSLPGYYCRPWRRAVSQPDDTGSLARTAEDKFQVSVDVQQFQPEEITVTVSDDNVISVEAKHEERPDEHGFISRQFVRKYALPKDHDAAKLQSNLSSDGVLTITAPKKQAVKPGQREVPVQQTGQPSRMAEPQVEPKPRPEATPVEKNVEIKQEGERKPDQRPVDNTGEKVIDVKLET